MPNDARFSGSFGVRPFSDQVVGGSLHHSQATPPARGHDRIGSSISHLLTASQGAKVEMPIK